MGKLEIIRSKIILDYNDKHFIEKLNFWRFKNNKIVFTNGCFDILHLGHIDYLSKAADLGSVLLIGLNSDRSVRQLKGTDRPYLDFESRSILLASLGFVDAVVQFDEDTPYKLIELVQPDILVKGSDYKNEHIVGYDIVSKKGGEVKTIDFLIGHSSTLVIERIKKTVIKKNTSIK
jgi:rfaE bifunctional protein nucleotidyltransferase chain/domain